MYRAVKKYTWNHDKSQTLNGAIMQFERFMKKKYGNKKYTVLLDAYIKHPESYGVDYNTYTVLFEFKKAKGESNVGRVEKRSDLSGLF